MDVIGSILCGIWNGTHPRQPLVGEAMRQRETDEYFRGRLKEGGGLLVGIIQQTGDISLLSAF